MDHMRGVEGDMRVPLEPDAEGYVGRECPNPECRTTYFKITPGTGLEGTDHFHCPYCGHRAHHSEFVTTEQIQYAESIAVRRIIKAFKVRGGAASILRYTEKDLETEIVCGECGLRYAIYGVFAYCPDCGMHNSLQILNTNLDLAGKKLELAEDREADLAQATIVDALQNAVAAFDAFGRESCRVNADKATDPERAESISFQNLTGARERFSSTFGFNLGAGVEQDDWEHLCTSFQKRHLFAHKAGVIDEEYVDKTGDSTATVGRLVSLDADEVRTTIALLRNLGQQLFSQLEATSDDHCAACEQ